MAKADLTAARLRELLDYNPETGTFTWLCNRGVGSQSGRVAGTLRPDGYLAICVDYRHFLAHRLAVLHMTGAMPHACVDHIDGDRANNRWCNLRTVSYTVNLQNVRAAKANSTSGLLGAFFNKSCGRWFSNIRVHGKRIPLGRFASAQEAHEAYIAAKRIYHEGCTI